MNITGGVYDLAKYDSFSGAFSGTRTGNVYVPSGTPTIDNSKFDSFTFDASKTWTGENKKTCKIYLKTLA